MNTNKGRARKDFESLLRFMLWPVMVTVGLFFLALDVIRIYFFKKF